MAVNPVTDEHVEFAHALVTLARQYGANRLKVEFDLSGSNTPRERRWDYERVTFDWGEGRHGDRSSFSLRGESIVHVEERPNSGASNVSK